MERPRAIKKPAAGSLSQQPVLLESPLSNIALSHRICLTDTSFPSYQADDPNNQADDTDQISIFDAQRYFSEGNNVDHRLCKRVSPLNMSSLQEHGNLSVLSRFSSASSADVYGAARNYRAASFHATPTASSEASWNSQTGLLSNPPGAIAVSMRNPIPATTEKKKGFAKTWLFKRRRCPCSGEKSVQVREEYLSEPKTSKNHSTGSFKSVEKTLDTPTWPRSREINANHHRVSTEINHHSHSNLQQRVLASCTRPLSDSSASIGFTFPVLESASSNFLDQVRKSRDSLEIFRPPDESDSRKSNEFQSVKLVSRQMLFPATTINDDDVASDASSDLFEIESLSTQTGSYAMCHPRDLLDEASSFNSRKIAPTTRGPAAGLYSPISLPIAPSVCYEPSEASIDWSITTAETFDRGTVAITDASETTTMAHGSCKKKGNGLWSCRCEKAVSVGPHPVKCVPPRERQAPHRGM